MKVSVIIPSFNRAYCVSTAIESVLSQTFSAIGEKTESAELEVIVVDDGSTDESRSLIEQNYPEVIYLYQSNQGVSAARNLGLARATGDWIALLDSDDEWLPNKLQIQFELLHRTELKVCHTEEIWIRNGIRVNQMKKHKKSGGAIFEHCLPLCAMSPSSIVIHRSVFDEIGVFDESLPACEDYDLWLRLTARYEVAFVQEPLIKKIGGHDDQLSRQHWGMDRFRVIALDKVLTQNAGFLNDAQAHAGKTMLVKKLTILRNGALKHNNAELVADCEQRLAKWASA